MNWFSGPFRSSLPFTGVEYYRGAVSPQREAGFFFPEVVTRLGADGRGTMSVADAGQSTLAGTGHATIGYNHYFIVKLFKMDFWKCGDAERNANCTAWSLSGWCTELVAASSWQRCRR